MAWSGGAWSLGAGRWGWGRLCGPAAVAGTWSEGREVIQVGTGYRTVVINGGGPGEKKFNKLQCLFKLKGWIRRVLLTLSGQGDVTRLLTAEL